MKPLRQQSRRELFQTIVTLRSQKMCLEKELKREKERAKNG